MPRLDGIDVSHYQYSAAPIHWQQVRDAGCWWGATKATQGTGYVDPTMSRSRQSMFAVGFTHIGLYHWLSPKPDPKAQALWFLSTIGELGRGEFAMLDAEEAGITVTGVVAWCETVEAVTHRPCVVYSGAYVAGGTIWRVAPVRRSIYGSRPMILAAYTSEGNAKTVCDFAHYPWDGWQFSSNGPVPGVTARCDMDRIDNRQAFDKATGTEPPPPIEVQPAPTVSIIPDPYDPNEDDMAGNAPLIKMDNRYNEAFLVGAGTPVWLTGEDLQALKASGVPVAESAAHPSFEIVAKRAGCDTLTSRG